MQKNTRSFGRLMLFAFLFFAGLLSAPLLTGKHDVGAQDTTSYVHFFTPEGDAQRYTDDYPGVKADGLTLNEGVFISNNGLVQHINDSIAVISATTLNITPGGGKIVIKLLNNAMMYCYATTKDGTILEVITLTDTRNCDAPQAVEEVLRAKNVPIDRLMLFFTDQQYVRNGEQLRAGEQLFPNPFKR